MANDLEQLGLAVFHSVGFDSFVAAILLPFTLRDQLPAYVLSTFKRLLLRVGKFALRLAVTA